MLNEMRPGHPMLHIATADLSRRGSNGVHTDSLLLPHSVLDHYQKYTPVSGKGYMTVCLFYDLHKRLSSVSVAYQ